MGEPPALTWAGFSLRPTGTSLPRDRGVKHKQGRHAKHTQHTCAPKRHIPRRAGTLTRGPVLFWEVFWPSLAPAEAEQRGPRGGAGKGAPGSSLAPGGTARSPPAGPAARSPRAAPEREGRGGKAERAAGAVRPPSPRPRVVRSPDPCRPVPRDARGRSRTRRIIWP